MLCQKDKLFITVFTTIFIITGCKGTSAWHWYFWLFYGLIMDSSTCKYYIDPKDLKTSRRNSDDLGKGSFGKVIRVYSKKYGISAAKVCMVTGTPDSRKKTLKSLVLNLYIFIIVFGSTKESAISLEVPYIT